MATEDTILFDDIGDGILLTLVEPAGHRREEHSEGARIEHGGRVYTTGRISGLKGLARAMGHSGLPKGVDQSLLGRCIPKTMKNCASSDDAR